MIFHNGQHASCLQPARHRTSRLSFFFSILLVIIILPNSSGAQLTEPDSVERQYSYLGVEVTDVSVRLALAAGLDRVQGAIIQAVIADSPAKRAGLKPGDVILSLNGRKIRSAAEFKNDLLGIPVGSQVQMCIRREDYVLTITAVTEAAPPSFLPVEKAAPYLGIAVGEVEKDSTEYQELEKLGKEGGVEVVKVIAGSPADRAGVEQGDIIMGFNSRKVRSVQEFLSDLAGAETGVPIKMCLMRGEIRKSVYPVLEPKRDEAGSLVADLFTSDETTTEKGSKIVEALKELSPQLKFYSRKKTPVPHYPGYFDDDSLAAVAYVTTEIVPEKSRGYQSAISVLVVVDLEGTIIGAMLLSQNESIPNAEEIFADFIEQYVGNSGSDVLVLGRDIDAISQATYSSSAIHQSILAGLTLITSQVLLMDDVETEYGLGDMVWSKLYTQIDALFLLLIVTLAVVAYRNDKVFLRFFTLGLTFIYAGFAKGGGFSLHDVVNLLGLNFPPVFLDSLYWYTLLAVVAVSLILAGRFYCGWICPFGALLELISTFKIPRINIPRRLDTPLRVVKYVILLSVLLIAFGMMNPPLADSVIGIVEPFETFFRLSTLWWEWLALLVILVLSVLCLRFYCRYLCPLGAVFALIVVVVSLMKRVLFKVFPTPKSYHIPCRMGSAMYRKEFETLRVDNNECISCSRCLKSPAGE